MGSKLSCCCCSDKNPPKINIKDNNLCNDIECSCLSKCCIKSVKTHHHHKHKHNKEAVEIYG